MSVALVLAIRRRNIRQKIAVSTARILSKTFRKTGISMIYPSYNSALDRMRKVASESKSIKLLTNKGTSWVSEDGVGISDEICAASNRGALIQFLFLSSHSPWLNTEWAQSRGKRTEAEVGREFKAAHSVIETFFDNKLGQNSTKSGILYHQDDPAWRLLITDNTVFVASYAHPKQARDALVVEIEGSDTEYFLAFNRYFDFLYRQSMSNDVPVTEDSRLVEQYNSFEFSVGAVVYRSEGNRNTFVVLERKKNRTFVLPKGHVENGETLEQAVLREVWEETSLNVWDADKKEATPEVRSFSSLGCYPNRIIDKCGNRVFKIVQYYLIEYTGNMEGLSGDEEHAKALWCTFDELEHKRPAYTHINNVIQEAKNRIQG